jgi:Asp-tRNA(Asn)/Glu-tRNA(Gln) amidotransferase A subunit family amidase
MATTTDLTGLSARELTAALADGSVSSAEAVEAHIARLEEVNPDLNAVAYRRYDVARQEARAADAARRRGEQRGVLRGLPVTVKDQFHVAGLPTSFGVTRLADRPVVSDGPMVAAWRDAGAVVIAKTSVPQGLGVYETANDRVGRTNNPWDLTRTPGGSSGGEAAVIAAGASPLGLGADFGGSLRVPAAWCGIATIKPTARRLPLDPAPVRTASGSVGIVGQPGPMARTVGDVSLGLRVLVDAEAARTAGTYPPVPWHGPDLVDLSELRVAVLEEVDGLRPATAVSRALRESSDALAAVGATVEVWTDPPDTAASAALTLRLLSADGFAFARQVIGSDAAHPLVKSDLQLMSVPRPLLRVLRAVMSGTGQRTAARFLRSLGRTSAEGLMDLLGDRLVHEAAFLGALDAGDYDLVLCPALPLPAPPHDQTPQIPHAFASVTLFNLLGLPAGVVPVTTVRSGEESQGASTTDRWRRAAGRAERGSVGLPVGVQLAARPWREDLVLAAMAAIESRVAGQPGHPTTPIALPSR